jgi:hypothetical protein
MAQFDDHTDNTDHQAADLVAGIRNDNCLKLASALAGTGPALQAVGNDTDIDVHLTPKGAGVVKIDSGGLMRGSPGSAAGQNEITKTLTGIVNNTATAILTVTVPNAQHNARIKCEFMGMPGSGGGSGIGCSTVTADFNVAIAREAAASTVAALSASWGVASAVVAGGDANPVLTAAISALTGSAGQSQTFTVNVNMNVQPSGASGHIVMGMFKLLNRNAAGITIS